MSISIAKRFSASAIAVSTALVLSACGTSAPTEKMAPAATTQAPAANAPAAQAAPPPAVAPAPAPTERTITNVAAGRVAAVGLDRDNRAAHYAGVGGIQLSAGSVQYDMPAPDTARYREYTDNPVKLVASEPLSTFGLDVDTASYANVRRFLASNRLPPADAVRVEELLNYFPSKPARAEQRNMGPFLVDYELTPSPWRADRALLRIGMQAQRSMHADKAPTQQVDENYYLFRSNRAQANPNWTPPTNLVLLVDVSGSMAPDDRLPLVKTGLKLLVEQMRSRDSIAIVTYANNTQLVLPPTPGDEKAKLRSAIESLRASGGTYGASGLKLAYEVAEQGRVPNGVNRVVLATDGDFNLGITDPRELKAFVERQRDSGITLSVLGVGSHNLNDAMMVQIADAGNGNYSYLDTPDEARKVLEEEMKATLVTVAKDVKAQIEFNPAFVTEYRQIGYEKRQLAAADFNNDKVDAGDIGAGKRVTVLYELTLRGQPGSVDAPRYPGNRKAEAASSGNELAFLKLRWKEPEGQASELETLPLQANALRANFASASTDQRFFAAVAAYGQKLRNHPALAATSWNQIADWANAARGEDPSGYRAEFVRLVRTAGTLAKTQ